MRLRFYLLETPISLLAKTVWNFCEYWNIAFPYPGWLFGLAIGCKKKEIK